VFSKKKLRKQGMAIVPFGVGKVAPVQKGIGWEESGMKGNVIMFSIIFVSSIERIYIKKIVGERNR
jgi:hypothetical protein